MIVFRFGSLLLLGTVLLSCSSCSPIGGTSSAPRIRWKGVAYGGGRWCAFAETYVHCTAADQGDTFYVESPAPIASVSVTDRRVCIFNQRDHVACFVGSPERIEVEQSEVISVTANATRTCILGPERQLWRCDDVGSRAVAPSFELHSPMVAIDEYAPFVCSVSQSDVLCDAREEPRRFSYRWCPHMIPEMLDVAVGDTCVAGGREIECSCLGGTDSCAATTSGKVSELHLGAQSGCALLESGALECWGVAAESGVCVDGACAADGAELPCSPCGARGIRSRERVSTNVTSFAVGPGVVCFVNGAGGSVSCRGARDAVPTFP